MSRTRLAAIPAGGGLAVGPSIRASQGDKSADGAQKPRAGREEQKFKGLGFIPVVSFVVPIFGFTIFILRILKGNPKRNYNGDYR